MVSTLIRCAIVLALSAMSALAQAVVFGPSFPQPPGGVTVITTGTDPADPGGLTYTFSNFNSGF